MRFFTFEQGPTDSPNHWLVVGIDESGNVLRQICTVEDERRQVRKSKKARPFYWVCPICKADFGSEDWIKHHFEAVHPEVKKVKVKHVGRGRGQRAK